MNSVIINNVNEAVMPDDRLFNMGDIAFKGAKDVLGSWRARINCKNIFVIPGNHDKEQIIRRYFTVLPAQYMYENNDYRIVLNHYALRVWESSHHGVAEIHGHSHGKLPSLPGVPSFDVGVDCWNFKPLNLSQVKLEMKRLVSLGDTKKCLVCGQLRQQNHK